MLNKPTVLAMTAAPLREALKQYGVDFDGLARRAGLDPGLLSRPNARYPVTAMQRLWDLAAKSTGDPLLGFRVGECMRPGMLHALGLGIVSSPSVLEALNPESTAARVRSLLLKAMSSGDVDQNGIARRLNQSPSTLQRRLRREGTTYQSLLDSTRRDLALDYLRQGRHSLADITFLLGFTDQSNFTRAFRRWTGKTPRQYMA